MWISTEDKVPEKDIYCLIVVGGYVQERFVRYKDGQWTKDGDMGGKENYPFVPEYWMPLPEPPEE